MGMFDHIHCDLPLPDGREVARDSFQTKSLWCDMERFTITVAGRLIHHRRRDFLASDPYARLPDPSGETDLDYHGDIEIYGLLPDGKLAYYAVRFTHGTVEWILPFDSLRSHHQWRPYRDY